MAEHSVYHYYPADYEEQSPPLTTGCTYYTQGMIIITNIYKYIQIYTNIYKYIQIYTNTHKYIQIYTNIHTF